MLSKMISHYDVTKVAVQQTQKVLTEHAPDREVRGRCKLNTTA